MRAWTAVMLFAWAILHVSSCSGPAIDIAKAVEITDLMTGWYDAGIENGMNKLVPTVGFRLKNVIALPIRNIQLNAVFRRVGEAEEWGSAYIRIAADQPLAVGGVTRPIVLRSNLGYTSTDPRSRMLQHSEFKDVQVKLFAKQGAAQWAPVGEWLVQRTLIVPTPQPATTNPQS